MTHVAHIVHRINIGGVWRHLEALDHLGDHGFQFTVVSLFDGNDESAVDTLSFPSIHLNEPIEFPLDEKRILCDLTSVLKSLDADVIHSHHYYSDIFAFLVSQKLNIPAIRSVHGVTQANSENPLNCAVVRYDWSPKMISRELSLEDVIETTIVVSKDLKRRLVSYGFPPNKLRVLYAGIDPDSVTEQAKTLSPPDEAKEFIEDDNVFRIGYVGRLEPVKNPLVLPIIMNRLTRLGVPVEVLMLGDGTLRSNLLELIEEYDLTQRVHLVSPCTNVFWIYDEVDTVLLPSLSEGLPWTVLEAMACKVPVVASDVGGIPEAVEDGATGYICSPTDLDEMVDACRKLAYNRKKRIQLGRAARSVIRKKFNVNQYISDLKETYWDCLHAYSTTRSNK